MEVRREDSDVSVYLIMDNLSIHGTPDVKAVLAKHDKVEVVRTPTSAPWLNLIEPWFSTITRRVLRNTYLQSHEEVGLVLSEFVADWRKTPKPYLWGRNGNGRRQLSAPIS